MNKDRETIIIVRREEVARRRPSRRRLEGRLCRLHDPMMALFLVLWLVTQSSDVRAAIAGYFQDPLGRANEFGSSIIQGEGAQAANPAPSCSHRSPTFAATAFRYSASRSRRRSSSWSSRRHRTADRDRPHRARVFASSCSRTRAASSSRPAAPAPVRWHRSPGLLGEHLSTMPDAVIGGRLHRRGTVLEFPG